MGTAMAGSFEDLFRAMLGPTVRDAVENGVRAALERIQPTSGSGGYLTIKEAALIAKVHPDTMSLWLNAGKLRKHHAGGRPRVRREDLDHFLASGPMKDESSGPSADEIAAAALAKRKRKGKPL